jgi:hypothetical protein
MSWNGDGKLAASCRVTELAALMALLQCAEGVDVSTAAGMQQAPNSDAAGDVALFYRLTE